MITASANAQIGDVQQKGSFIYSYNENGQSIGNFNIESGQFLGYSNSIIVIKRGDFLHSYDAKGNPLGNFLIYSSDKFKGVNGKNINILRGIDLYTFDTKGNKIAQRNYWKDT